MNKHPRVSIVTPCYNSEKYLEDCILSIMRQSYDNVEHIIVDGGSSDRTLEIIEKYYGKYDMRYISERDNGMYDAITKGFAISSGDIFAWLNSDDMYTPWATQVAADVMQYTDIRWLIGVFQTYTAEGVGHRIPRITPVFPQSLIKRGYMDNRICNFLQQESMFWSRELWERNCDIVKRYRLAGDYHLWKAFAATETLYSVDSVLSGIRIHEGQLSGDLDKYYAEVGELSLSGKLLCRTKLLKMWCIFRSLTTSKLRFKYRTLENYR